jgi:glycosyltransferase involved in cell wall biosynthesis
MVFDFDDAIFLLSDRNRKRMLATLRVSDAVVTSVRSNAAFAARMNSHVTTLLTPVDTSRLIPRRSLKARASLRVGWIGTPSTTPYLQDIVGDLEQITAAERIEYVFIGAAHFRTQLPDVRFVPWSRDAEERLLPTFDIGLMPLRGGAWEEGKGGYKALQYMACGVPTVASDVPAGRLAVVPGTTGLLVPIGHGWAHPIECLLNHPDVRARMSAASRERAARHFSIERCLPEWEEALFGTATDEARCEALVGLN